MKDKIVREVIEKYKDRSAIGQIKYGKTLEENNTDDYLNHLQQELMDATLYIQKLISGRRLVHIFPMEDNKEHVVGNSTECHCIPAIVYSNDGNKNVLHNSYLDPSKVEWVEQKINEEDYQP
jgi:hypothetical protein